MFAFYIFLLTYKIVATLICVLFAVKIARLHLTQTTTWYLLAAAFSIRLLAYLNSIIFAQDILGFLKSYNLGLILYSQAIEATIVTLFATAMLRSYYGVKNAKLPFEK